MTEIDAEAGLTSAQKHALRLGIQVQTTEARGSAERLAEQVDGEDPSWPDTLRILADANAAKRAEDFAKFVAGEAARNKPRVDPQIAAKPAEARTTRGRIAAEMVRAEAGDRAAEAKAAAEFLRLDAAERAARPAGRVNGPPPRPMPKWERDQARARLARLTDDAA